MRPQSIVVTAFAVAGLVVVALVAIGGLFLVHNAIAAHQTVEVDGSFTIEGTTCALKDVSGYNDIQQGQVVKITDQTGKQVGAASLEPCVDGTDGASAVFDFTTTVPKSQSYGFTVADRGTVQYAYDFVKNNNVELTLSGS